LLSTITRALCCGPELEFIDNGQAPDRNYKYEPVIDSLNQSVTDSLNQSVIYSLIKSTDHRYFNEVPGRSNNRTQATCGGKCFLAVRWSNSGI